MGIRPIHPDPDETVLSYKPDEDAEIWGKEITKFLNRKLHLLTYFYMDKPRSQVYIDTLRDLFKCHLLAHSNNCLFL